MEKIYTIGPYRFEIVPSNLCDYSDRRVPKLLQAALATLRGTPRSVLAQKLRAKRTYCLVVTLVSEKRMRALNFAFRKKDRPTDVLSFSQLEGPEIPTIQYHIGEVILCPTYAKRKAKIHGVSWEREMALLTIHGVLHLLGYDHEQNEADAKIMFALQDKILRRHRGATRG